MALTTHGVNSGENFMKKVLIGVIVVLVVIGGAGVYVFLNAGGIIKQIVEEVGSEATKTKVSLSEVDLSIQSGEAALKGFQMGNPSGFQCVFQIGSGGKGLVTAFGSSSTRSTGLSKPGGLILQPVRYSIRSSNSQCQ